MYEKTIKLDYSSGLWYRPMVYSDEMCIRDSPYGHGASLYIRPYMMGTNSVIGVKPADEYQFRVFTTPVGPYFKGGAKPIKIRITDFDRAAPHGTGHIKAGLNYAMSLYAITDAHNKG